MIGIVDFEEIMSCICRFGKMVILISKFFVLVEVLKEEVKFEEKKEFGKVKEVKFLFFFCFKMLNFCFKMLGFKMLDF